MSQLYLIRHGQAGPRHDYDTLSELGERQSRLLGSYFAAHGVRFGAAYSGTLERQRRTAQAVREACLEAGLDFPEVEENPLWDEFDMGQVYAQLAEPLSRENPEFERLYKEMQREMQNPHAAVHRLHNYCDIAVVRAWVSGKYPYRGESWPAFRERIRRALDSVNGHASGARLAVFTSATPVGIAVGRALELDERQVWRVAGVAYNSGLTALRLARDELRLFSFNALPHLPDPDLWSFR